MTDLEKLELKQEILAWIKGQAISILDLPTLGSIIDLDYVVVGHNGKTYKSVISNILSGVGGDYTDAQARAAMGSKADNNPFNHDRYTDAEALSAAINDTGTTTEGWSASKLISTFTDYYTSAEIDILLVDYYTKLNLNNNSATNPGASLIGVDSLDFEELSGVTVQAVLLEIDNLLYKTETMYGEWDGVIYSILNNGWTGYLKIIKRGYHYYFNGYFDGSIATNSNILEITPGLTGIFQYFTAYNTTPEDPNSIGAFDGSAFDIIGFGNPTDIYIINFIVMN